MEEWDISVVSPQLKGKQEEMQGELTGIFDILNSMKAQAVLLEDNWTGEAGRVYCGVLCRELSRNYEYVQKIGGFMERLSQMEKNFEACEARILSLIG